MTSVTTQPAQFEVGAVAPEATVVDRRDRMRGVLLGGAVADSIGLPFEGMSRRRVDRFLGEHPLSHRLLFGAGMCSDDTEHACMTGQALIASHGDEERFARSLAWRLRWWLVGVPAATGWATLRAIVRLWCGVNPGRSGVASAGNGPAMRAPLIGVWAGDDRDLLVKVVRVSTWMTHLDTAALQGAMVTALAAHHAASHTADDIDIDELFAAFEGIVDHAELTDVLRLVREHLRRGDDVGTLIDAMGLANGVGGYIVHTVPVALMCWLTHPGDYRRAVESVVRAGGDTDSTAALVGALVGATGGEACVPDDWRTGVIEWPRSTRWILRLADRLAEASPVRDTTRSLSEGARPVRLFVPALLARNLLFLFVVLAHGVRRMLPPY